MKVVFFVCYLLLVVNAYSQKEYAVSKIDPALRKNADVVIRNNAYVHTVLTPGKASTYEKIVVTVFNEKGENRFSYFSRFYNKFFEIHKLEGAVYDSIGNKIKSIKKSDIKDYSTGDASYEITDGRQKLISFDKKKYSYPYTIEFVCVSNDNIGMFYPTWVPIEEAHTGIEKTVFSIIIPKAQTFRYKEVNLLTKVSVTHNIDEDMYSWQLENYPPMDFESYMPANSLPVVYTAPNAFEVEAYKGNASSWEDIGKFYLSLNANRQELPESTKLKVKELIRNEKDTLKQIKILYKYMQSTTRYISIQLGIGGWQAMKAYDVAQTGYGDCKALSNYMIALLKEAGITANPVLVNAGNVNGDTQADFPFFRFNHVIACVPFYKDTLWLECTSQIDPPGYLGSFTGNRKALVMNETKSKLVNTIRYTANTNIQSRKAEVVIHETGDASAVIKTIYKGIQQEDINAVYHYLNKERQREAIVKRISIPNFELTGFSLKEHSASLPEMEEDLTLKIHKMIPKASSVMFIVPHLLPSPIYTPPSLNERKSAFYLNPTHFNYATSDTIVYRIPKEYTIESLPQAIRIESLFGNYTVSFTFENHQLVYCRSLALKGGTFPASEYANWINFTKQINKNDKLKLILKKGDQ